MKYVLLHFSVCQGMNSMLQTSIQTQRSKQNKSCDDVEINKCKPHMSGAH